MAARIQGTPARDISTLKLGACRSNRVRSQPGKDTNVEGIGGCPQAVFQMRNGRRIPVAVQAAAMELEREIQAVDVNPVRVTPSPGARNDDCVRWLAPTFPSGELNACQRVERYGHGAGETGMRQR